MTTTRKSCCLARWFPKISVCWLGSLQHINRPCRLAITSSFPPLQQGFAFVPVHRCFGITNTTNMDLSQTEGVAPESEVVRACKQALRKEIRSKVRELSQEDLIAQSEMVWERIFQLPEFQSAKSVGLFLSMPKNEIKTETALRHCVEQNKIIYVPEVGKNFESADMELLRVSNEKDENGQLFYESWPKNKWQIPEPPESMLKEVAQPGDIDVLIVPGLGFDRKGNRIGQGKGYYDRFIARITKDSKPKLIAVTLDCQLVESVPVSPTDRIMDKIVLPSEIIDLS